MLRTSLLTTTVAMGLLAIVPSARAQEPKTSPEENKTFVDRIEDFGRNILGGFGGSSAKESKTDRSSNATNNNSRDAWSGMGPSRARQYPSASSQASSQSFSRSGAGRPAAITSDTATGSDAGDAATPRGSHGSSTPSVKRRWNPGSVTEDDEMGFSVASGAAELKKPPPAQNADNQPTTKAEAGKSEPAPKDAPAAEGVDPNSLPLHERMAALRRSPFASSAKAADSSAVPPVAEQPTVSSNRPAADTPAAASMPSAAAVPVAETQPNPATPVSPVATPAAQRPTYAQRETSDSPAIPQRSTPVVWRADQLNEPEPMPRAVAAAPSTPVASPSPPVASPSAPVALPVVGNTPAKSVDLRPVAPKPNPNVLLARQSPILAAETVGPRRIIVGKESVYEITMHNSGAVPADEVLVLIDLPTSADVLGAETSIGGTQLVPVGTGSRQFQWKLGHLDAKGQERLRLRIVPRESRPIDLAIRWDFKQLASQTVIEVEEPKLSIQLDGPRDVLFGKKELYKLKIANTGNGEAENVVVKLLPVGSPDAVSATHNFGTLLPGTDKTIEVELVARQAGSLTMKAEVSCDNGAHAELAESIQVRRAALQISVEGPKLQYVDALGSYRIRVSNPGTAPARQLVVTATLPEGAKFVASNDAAQLVDGRSLVRWRLDELSAGSEKVLELRCTLTQAGSNRVEIAAAGVDDVAAAASAVTRVETMADLVMEVIDPAGPVPLNEDAVYELRILNRGTRGAEEIDVVAFFSQGIEPATAQGAPARLAPGQVTFDTISSLHPGKEIRLKIYARAQTPGAHIFRAEVHCRPLGTRLVREETTHFYASDGGATAPVATSLPARSFSGPSDSVRTAERRSLTPVKEEPSSNSTGILRESRPTRAIPDR